MHREKVGEPDDEHHRGILHVDDIVVADLGHDVPQRLGQNHIQHRLPVVHADGLGALKLAHVDAHDAAAHGFRHVGARVDGNNDDAHRPDILEGHAEEIRQPVIDEHRLQNHGRSPENLHIHPDNHPDQLQQESLEKMVIRPVGNRLQYPAEKPDHAADQRRRHRQDQRIRDPGQIHRAVFLPEPADIGK